MLSLLQERGSSETICPSEVARSLRDEDRRSLMPLVREASRDLVEEGIVEVTQNGDAVDPVEGKGEIRTRLVAGAEPNGEPT
jgi:hypothetical protein